MMKKNWISIIVIFIGSIIMYFAYGLCHDNFIVGLFSPTNNSSLEYTKVILLPTILYYLFMTREDGDRHYLRLFVMLIMSIFSMLSLFWVIRGLLHFDSLIVNAFILFLAILIGNFISSKVYDKGYFFKRSFLLTVLLLIVYVYITITSL